MRNRERREAEANPAKGIGMSFAPFPAFRALRGSAPGAAAERAV